MKKVRLYELKGEAPHKVLLSGGIPEITQQTAS